MSIILAQTDTTVGFLSQDRERLSQIKSRNNSKPFIKVYTNFEIFLKDNLRIPQSKRNFVRRSKKTTFIIKNRSFRVASSPLHSQILRDFEWSYSTSANEAGKNYDREFCESKADIIIQNRDGLVQNSASSLYKINNYKTRRLR